MMSMAAQDYAGVEALPDHELNELFRQIAEKGIRLWVEEGVIRFSAPQGAMTEDLKTKLKEKKSAIIQELQNTRQELPLPALERLDRTAPLPASSGQERLWYLDRVEGKGAYSLPFALRVKGRLLPDDIVAALKALALRHEAFRTLLKWEEDKLVQVISEVPQIEIETLEIAEEKLGLTLQELATRPLSCEKAPIGRAYVLKIADGDYVILLVLHHAVSDGWSASVIARDIITGLSQGPAALEPKKYDCADFCAQRNKADEAGHGKSAAAWWSEHLEGAPSLSTFPWNLPRRAERSGRAGTLSQALTHEFSQEFDAFLQREKLLAFSTLNALHALGLAAMSGQRDVIVGAPVANRQRPQEIEECVGLFVNTIARRYAINFNQGLRSFLKENHALTRKALSYQSYPFDAAVESSGVIRASSFLPLVQTVMAVQSLPFDGALPAELSFSTVMIDPAVAKFDWVTYAWKAEDVWFMQCEYDADLYSKGWAEAIFNAYQETLMRCIACPEASLEEISAPYLPLRKDQRLVWAEEIAQSLYCASNSLALLRADSSGALVISLYMDNPELSQDARTQLSRKISEKCAALAEVIPLKRFPLTAAGDIDLGRLLLAPMLTPEAIQAIEKELGGSLEPLPVKAEPLPKFELGKLAPELRPKQTKEQSKCSAPVTLPPSGSSYLKGEELVFPEGYVFTLPEALEKTAREHPDNGLVIVSDRGDETPLSYRELYSEAMSVASALNAKGVSAGSFVLLQVHDLRLYFPAVWGCFLSGATPVSVSQPLRASENDSVFMKLVSAWNLLQNPLILHEEHNKELLESGKRLFGAGEVNLAQTEELLTAKPLDKPAKVSRNDIGLLQLTSGSTGASKGVMLHQEGIARHVAGTSQLNGYDPTWTNLNWLHYDHVGALLVYHLTDAWIGCSQVVVSSDLILREPVTWLRLMEKYSVSRSWSPNFGYKLLLDYARKHPDESWDLSKLRYLMNGGEQLTPSVLREFEEFLLRNKAQKSVMQPAYGTAETCSTICYENQFSADTAIHAYDRGVLENGIPNGDIVEFVSLGGMVPGNEARIIDAEGKTLPERRIGRLISRGKMQSPGYYANPEATDAATVDDGWLDSGDLAFVDRGRLFMTGRAKEVIILNGANYYCHEFEELLADIPGIKSTWIASVGARVGDAASEELALFFVPEPEVPDEKKLREIIETVKFKIVEHFSLAPRWCLPLPADRLPKGTSGKIQRNKLRRSLENGEFAKLMEQYGQGTVRGGIPAWLARPLELADNGMETVSPAGFRRLILKAEAPEAALEETLEALSEDAPLLLAVQDEHPDSKNLYAAVAALADSFSLIQPKRDLRCILAEGSIDAALAREAALQRSHGSIRIRYSQNGKRLKTWLAPLEEKNIASGAPVNLALPCLILDGSGKAALALAEDIFKRGSGRVYLLPEAAKPERAEAYTRLKELGGERLILLEADEDGGLPRLEPSEWGGGGLIINDTWTGGNAGYMSVKGIIRAIQKKSGIVKRLKDATAGLPVTVAHIGSLGGCLGGAESEAASAVSGWLQAEAANAGQRVLAFSKWEDDALIETDMGSGLHALSSQNGTSLFWLGLRGNEKRVLAGLDLSARELAARASSGPVFADNWTLFCNEDRTEQIKDAAGKPLLLQLAKKIPKPAASQRSAEESISVGMAKYTPDTARYLEKQLFTIWAEVLGQKSFGPADNFFAVGGSSLLLMQVQKRVEEALGRPVSAVTLYQYPSISALAAHLTGKPKAASNSNRPTISGTVELAAKRKRSRIQSKNDQGDTRDA